MSMHSADTNTLYFYEEIMLLSLREDDGKIDRKAQFEYQNLLAAALLAELVMLERVEITDKKKKTVSITSTDLIGDRLLDEALEKIVKSKDKTATHWVMKFQGIRNLRGKAAESLVKRGILAAEDGTAFFFFDKTYYPELNPRPEQRLVHRLEKAIFGSEREIDPRTLVLLALLRKSELLKIPFDAKALKERRHRMKEVCEGDLIAEAAHQAVEAAQTAIFVAAIMPAITTTVIAG